MDDLTMHVRQPAINAIVTESQLFVVDAEEVKNRRVKVVAGGLAFDRFPGPLVALTVGDAGFDSGPGEPRDERAAVMIAPNAAWPLSPPLSAMSRTSSR
jgi:hypothetical protein